MYAVIMAGGKGTRFWPLSREKKPKHLLNITGKKTIIQYTVDRVTPLVEKDNILIVTGASHCDEIREQLPELPAENILIEPVGRNTAPCIGLAAIHIRKRDPDAVMFVLPSDHLITNAEGFLASLTTAREMAKREPCLVTIGIKPRWPETGYGYMERGTVADTIGETKIYAVRSFREKPDQATAEAFFRDGGFFWNSGMFIWKASTILDNIKKLIPDLYEGLLTIEDSIGTKHEEEILSEVYRNIKPVSIDYGVMEKAPGVCMVEGDFGWNDIGSWDALWDVMDKDDKGNATRGNIIRFDTSNSLVYSPQKMVALIGVEDLIVVETEDSLLICRRGSSQDVKKVVKHLEEKGMKEYL
ncbi:MAG: mannose-1-phosphate guanylyltransferase [Deltaproteobacteria bacterium]|nr:mannose-1-phosphate guanylyltransferase [Deltaproteobacteria bacterium]